MSDGFHPAIDQLGLTAPLVASLQVPLLGVPVLYRSNSAAVIAAAARSLGRWSELPTELIEPGPPARVDIVVHPPGAGEPAAAPAGQFVARAHGDTLLAAAGGSLMMAQPAHGAALAFVTPELAADPASLQHSVIERLGLLLVSERDRTPVPAAGVVHSGRAVLLVGAGGADTSTLCYACVRAGFALISGGALFVSVARGVRIWGLGGPLHLPPDAPRLFPELAGLEPQRCADGRLGLAVEAPGPAGPHAGRATVCLVERGAGQPSRLEPVAPAEAAAQIADPQRPGLELQRERAPAVAAALAAGGAYRLTVGADPASAAALLAHLAEQPL